MEHIFYDLVEKSFIKTSKLNDDLLNANAMSGKMTRHFYNNILSYIDARVLDIGVFNGITSCSGFYNNNAKITIIENFSQFGEQKQELLSNIEKYKDKNEITLFLEDCFAIDKSKFKYKFNIYIYDGNHRVIDQYNALSYYYDVLDDIFIYIVDDYNYEPVRLGTLGAITDLNLQVLHHKAIKTNHQHEEDKKDYDGFWNGVGVFVLKK